MFFFQYYFKSDIGFEWPSKPSIHKKASTWPIYHSFVDISTFCHLYLLRKYFYKMFFENSLQQTSIICVIVDTESVNMLCCSFCPGRFFVKFSVNYVTSYFRLYVRCLSCPLLGHTVPILMAVDKTNKS